MKKIVQLVSSTDKIQEEYDNDNDNILSFNLEIDDIVERYSEVMSPNDLIAILANTQLAVQLAMCIDLGEEDE